MAAEAWVRPATAVRPRWDANRMTDFSPTRQLESLPPPLQTEPAEAPELPVPADVTNGGYTRPGERMLEAGHGALHLVS